MLFESNNRGFQLLLNNVSRHDLLNGGETPKRKRRSKGFRVSREGKWGRSTLPVKGSAGLAIIGFWSTFGGFYSIRYLRTIIRCLLYIREARRRANKVFYWFRPESIMVFRFIFESQLNTLFPWLNSELFLDYIIMGFKRAGTGRARFLFWRNFFRSMRKFSRKLSFSHISAFKRSTASSVKLIMKGRTTKKIYRLLKREKNFAGLPMTKRPSDLRGKVSVQDYRLFKTSWGSCCFKVVYDSRNIF